jgi:hypothetical protein
MVDPFIGIKFEIRGAFSNLNVDLDEILKLTKEQKAIIDNFKEKKNAPKD